MNSKIILLIGKPGSGKGTQAKLLSEKTGWKVISSGDVFRAIMQEDSVVGRKAKEVVDKGLLMPPWFASYLFQKAIFALPDTEGVIFDGFGRKVVEAQQVLEILEWLGRPFDAIHIKVSDEDVIKRLTLRREVSGRADDHAIEQRLDEYRIHTEPSVEVFRKAGSLIEIDGSPTPEEISKEIDTALGIV
ncbi:MAG: adenylate kinase [Parcubacteria group bacterium]|nr:adenylate kinase [Parcubacteria group bacterium]